MSRASRATSAAEPRAEISAIGCSSAGLASLLAEPDPVGTEIDPLCAELGAEERDAVLAALRDSRLALKRAIYRGVRSVALLGIYSDRASDALTGYPLAGARSDVSIEDAMRYPVEL